MSVPDPALAVLILGGTTEGYALAAALADRPGMRVVSSLAGRTANPRHPAGELRVGGFGGPDALAEWLRRERIGAVIDATHPFASRMGWNAAAACAAAAIPLLRLERPAWQPGPGDRWQEVPDWAEAASRVGATARHVLLALGRQELAPFAGLDHVRFLIRSVDPPDPMPPFAQAELLLARGPFTEADEVALLQGRGIDTIVCKNSGGTATDAKLAAARRLGVRVIMRQRPPRPDLHTVATVAAAFEWVEEVAESGKRL
ncbi:Precorrin-6A reductase [Rhodovastum atsumiense]|uniref:Cobalt-precorrin-6A reductase n=1 Tax=Rhodovastum atsumiense TaxID=504468 RepID=A0A5M6IWW3_9PROT|nr:cobalt-precorrin-6A reductase [Rhodovastum atsumiense]KAA5612820.1 cobalt-precorrin-6A reductase [Rhodovastum atsumiense]CAH2601116.1 Precorrin-6A reductase [Rhodovastum atsumiense]